MIQNRFIVMRLEVINKNINKYRQQVLQQLQNYKEIISMLLSKDNLSIDFIDQFDFDKDLDSINYQLLGHVNEALSQQQTKLTQQQVDLMRNSLKTANMQLVKQESVQQLQTMIDSTIETFGYITNALSISITELKQCLQECNQLKALLVQEKEGVEQVTQTSSSGVDNNRLSRYRLDFFGVSTCGSDEQLDCDYKNYQL